MLTRRTLLVSLFALAIGAAGASSPTFIADGDADAATGRVVTIGAGPFEPGDMAEVHWSGFTPNEPVYLYICGATDGDPALLPDPSWCYGETLVAGTSDNQGAGSATVEIRSRLTPQSVLSEKGIPEIVGASYNVDCRFSGCEIIASECSATVPAGLSATSGNYNLVAMPEGTDPGKSDDPYVDGVQVELVEGFPEYGYDWSYVRKPYPPPKEPPDPPSGVVPTGPRVLTAGSGVGSVIYNNWGRGVAGALNTSFGFLELNPNEAIDDVIAGERDVAFTAAPVLTDEQRAALAAQGSALVAVPVSVSTLAFGINAYPVLPLRDLKVSARSAAGFLYNPGQPGVDAATTRSPEFQANMGACTTTRALNARPFIKGGPSDAAYVLSSWLDGAASDVEWPFGAADELPRETAQSALKESAVVSELINPKQNDNSTLQRYARLGVIDSTWARRYEVPEAQLRNAAGKWVRPSAAGALATLETSPIGDDHIVDVDYNSLNEKAYPLVSVTYALVSTHLSEEFTAEQAEAVKAMLSYFISDTGQGLAEAEGYVPMPFDLRLSAANAIEQIGSVAPPPPPESTTTSTTAATTTSIPADTSSSSSTSSAPDSTSTTSSTPAPTTTRPASPQTTRPATPSATTNPATTAPGGSTTTADTGAADDAGPAGSAPGAVGPDDDPPPPDEFSDDLGPLPSAPALPTLGAAGAAAVVSGQGIALWRRQLRRSKFTPISP